MPDFKVRDARYSDLPAIATLLTKAFWDDVLLGELIHPHRAKFPADNELWWLRRARVLFWDYRRKWLVAVQEKDGRESIVGIAQWERIGRGGKKLDLWWFDPRNLLHALSSAWMKVHATLWPDRAADPANEDIMERAHAYYETIWSGDREESWYLEWCAVHPDVQGNGVGRELVKWGLEQAENERICASVVSAWGKDEFYRKCGFDEQFGSAKMGEGNPLAEANVKGCNMWWRMPKEE